MNLNSSYQTPIAMTRGGSTYYLTYDQVGSLKAVADNTGNVVKRIDYDSFGNIIADTCDLPQYYHNFCRINDRKI